ncbi:MAG: UDP-N-acetylglucosamine 1-carboxyvinyltransferase, partial [Desulfobulbaceae bacterium]|nr:UDP-N-acetylglucosamine 1-carboxyvinyltransferase [Desulfobulbaceae bacterium]
MDKIVIKGGRPLFGEVRISGAKNAALPLIAATLLTPGLHTLHNVPDLRDTRTILLLLGTMGVKWERDGSTVRIDSTDLSEFEASYELVKTMRASVLVLGPLLARLGRARVSLPGGCAIGARPINLHLDGLKRLGVTVELEKGYVDAIVDGPMHGNTIVFDKQSVTATENILMAAVVADGTTVIKNVAREPEIGNLIDMLTIMGARIKGRDTSQLEIEGVNELRPAEISIIPDRIEAGTYALAVCAAGGDATIVDCIPEHLSSLIDKLQTVGVTVEESGNSIRVIRKGPIYAVDVSTATYPGFPTDLQAQMMALMALSNGASVIDET